MHFDLKLYPRNKPTPANTFYFRLSKLYGIKKQDVYNKIRYLFPELKVVAMSLFRTAEKALVRIRFTETQNYPWNGTIN